MDMKVKLGTAVALLIATTAFAQTPAQNIQHHVKHGQNVRVTDEQGREFRGRIGEMTADRLTLVSAADRADIPYEQIVRIDRPADTLANGALIGFGVGAAFGFLGIAAEDARSCDPQGSFYCSNPGAASYFFGTAIFGGLGSALGVGIDALIRREPNLYRRGVSARVGLLTSPRKGSGVALSLRW